MGLRKRRDGGAPCGAVAARAHPDKQRGAHTLWAQLERAARLELGPCEMAVALRDGPAARFIALQGAYDTLRSRNSNI